MSDHFEKVKGYLQELGFLPIKENKTNQIVVIEDEERGIKNLIIDCEPPILILEQFIFDLKEDAPKETLRKLLQMNRNLVHGAFVIDDSGKKVLFRDTLQLENLDLNEIEASINALSIAMVENSNEIVRLARNEGE